MPYIKRAAEEKIVKVSKMFPILLVTEPRQVGKATSYSKTFDRADLIRH